MVELSSLDVRTLARELQVIEDAYIDKVHQLTDQDIVLKLRRSQQGTVHLRIRPGQYAALAPEPPEAPLTPTNFAMALRKMLTGARVRRVEQHRFDRVLRVHLERGGEPHELVIELFGKGNLILAGPDGNILMAGRTETFSSRTVKRGEPLRFPPDRVDPTTMGRADFDTMVAASDKDLVRFLALDVALGGELAEEVVHRAGLEKNRKARQLARPEQDRVWTSLRELLESPPDPGVIDGVPSARLSTYAPQSPSAKAGTRRTLPTISQAILEVAAAEEAARPAEEDAERARLERQIQHQERGIREMQEEAGKWERRGHLVFAHYADVAKALQKTKAAIEAQGWGALQERWTSKAFEADSWMALLHEVDAKRARILLKLETEEVPLDPLASVESNATTLYDESKRIRAKAENAKTALEDARRRLALREKAAPTARKEAGPKAPKKRFWFESHRWFYSSEGFLVVAGRDASSNEKLVRRHLSAGDRYVHADFHGAPSCIVKGEGRVPGEATMREACQFGVTNSRAFSQFAAADAYWVLPEQVSKQAESGEYVPKGSFIIRGTRNYCVKLPLEQSLGIVRLDNQGRIAGENGPHPRLMAGPPTAVEKHASKRVTVARGDQKPSDAAKKIAQEFNVSIDEAVAALPPGNVRILQGGGGA